MLVCASASISLNLQNNIIVTRSIHLKEFMQYKSKPVEMFYVHVNKDPVKAPQNLAASLLEVLWERNVFCHGEN